VIRRPSLFGLGNGKALLTGVKQAMEEGEDLADRKGRYFRQRYQREERYKGGDM
jgi:hypothetical protein